MRPSHSSRRQRDSPIIRESASPRRHTLVWALLPSCSAGCSTAGWRGAKRCHRPRALVDVLSSTGSLCSAVVTFAASNSARAVACARCLELTTAVGPLRPGNLPVTFSVAPVRHPWGVLDGDDIADVAEMEVRLCSIGAQVDAAMRDVVGTLLRLRTGRS